MKVTETFTLDGGGFFPYGRFKMTDRTEKKEVRQLVNYEILYLLNETNTISCR